MSFVSKAEFARLRGVTRGAVNTWRQRGLLILSKDGRVDVEATNKLLDGRPEVHNGGVTSRPSGDQPVEAPNDPHAPAGVPAWTTAEAVRQKEIAVARLKNLEFDLKSGRLLVADEVEASWRSHITDARKRLLTVSSRCGARIAHLSRTEIDVIDREIRDALQELSGADAPA